MQKKQRGFTLIELLIVMAIILIIAGLAIPNVMRNRIQGNEVSAINSLRTLNSALVLYSNSYGPYPPALINLQAPTSGNPTSAAADLIDQLLASGTKAGYQFVYTLGPSGATYTIIARPLAEGQTGSKHFYTDQAGTIRASTGADANSSSTPI